MISQSDTGHRCVPAEWNETARPGLVDTLPRLFEAQALRTAEKPAVVHGTTTLTYRELNERANRLARVLIGRGAGPERLVALALPRSARMVVAILAVVKAGAAWIPVDPEYPAARIDDILDSARPLLVVTAGDLAAVLPGVVLPAGTDTLNLDGSDVAELLALAAVHDVGDDERTGPLFPDHPAYVIFTSGSTGTPKGVVMTHRGLGSLAADHIERFGIAPGDGVLQFASFNFDCSVGDLVMAVLSGSALIVRPRDCLSGRQLGDLIRRTSATHVTIPPQVLAALPPDANWSLRSIATAGDVLTAELVDRWAPGRRLFNAYGPTEATVDSVAVEVRAGVPTVPPIGRPILNTRAYVLDHDLREAPVGTEGELFIAGPGLARGYLGRPGLTAERFVACPFGKPGELMYRTGDLAKWRDDGNLVFLGRADDQVKIRGFRIEPGETESVLRRHPDVADAVVTPREDRPGHKRLVAYVVPSPGAVPDSAALRRHVATNLPDYFVPAAIVVLDTLPLNPNGKLDRKALPAPELSAAPAGRAARTDREELLSTLFGHVLGLDRVGIDDGFFDLGGDSVMVIQLAARAHRAGWVLEPADVFAHQRVAALAELLTPVDADPPDGERPGENLGPVPATVAPAGTKPWQYAVVPIPAGADPGHLTEALQAVFDHHDVLRLERLPDGSLRIRPPGSVDAAASVRRIPVDGLGPGEAEAALARAAADTAGVPEPGTRADGQSGGDGASDARDRWAYAVWGAAEGGPGLLLLLVHPIVADAQSWRILLADLWSAWTARAADVPVVLPPVVTSYRRWALHRAAIGTGTGETEPARQARRSGAVTEPPPGDEERGTAGELTASVPTELVGPLLGTVPATFNAEARDVLLTGLVLAAGQWRARHDTAPTGPLLVELEDDGRRAFAPGVDLSHTLGRFATSAPLSVDPGLPSWPEVRAGAPAVGDVLKEVKERVRALSDRGTAPACGQVVPDRPGIGYSQRGPVTDGGWENAAAGAAPYGPAEPSAPGLSLTTLVGGSADRPRLTATWRWTPDGPGAMAVRELADLWSEALRGIVAHAERPGAGGPTPSDLTLLSLSQDEIDDLASELADDF